TVAQASGQQAAHDDVAIVFVIFPNVGRLLEDEIGIVVFLGDWNFNFSTAKIRDLIKTWGGRFQLSHRRLADFLLYFCPAPIGNPRSRVQSAFLQWSAAVHSTSRASRQTSSPLRKACRRRRRPERAIPSGESCRFASTRQLESRAGNWLPLAY